MITRDNLSSVLDMLTEEQINNAMDANCDHICMWLGSYGHVYLDPIHSNCIEVGMKCAEETGGVFCDKDDFLRLFSESESINPFLIELI